MAANSSVRRGVAALGKRLAPQICWAQSSSRSLSAPAVRSVHTSVYDKNVDDHVRPAVVPDEIIQPQSDKYWGPNPNTGVFGPSAEQNMAACGERGLYPLPSESVLDQKAFFRSIENLDKPMHP